ncbi:hypothetical protein Tco_1135307 [Tanacetum coccineum]
MYGHDYTWSLEKLGTVINISSQGRLFYSDSTNTNEFTKYNQHDPIDYAYINASEVQNTIFKRPHHCDGAPYHYWDASYLQERLKMWEHVLISNVFVKLGSKEQTDIEYEVSEHGASSSRRPQLDSKERIESQINEWLDEDTWIGAKEEISSNEVIEKEVMERLSTREKMAYNSYLTSKRQHRESRTKMEIMKNFLKKWATTMSCKDI